MKLLIVDDNAGIRRLLRRALADSASAIWECADGAEALDAYKAHQPDFVLMDIRMPQVDGLSATRKIRAYDPAARIVVITDYDDPDVRAAALEAGAQDYVLKQEIASFSELILSRLDANR